MMGFLNTVLKWARSAWGLIAGIPGDVGNALIHLWNFVGSQHMLLDHLVSRVIRDLNNAHLGFTMWLFYAIEALWDALLRVRVWIWRHYILPLRADYLRRIAALKRWTAFWITRVWVLELQLYAQARAYAARLTAAERGQRIAADRAEHAAMVKAVARALATVQTEAAGGYRDGSRQRVSTITKITDDLVTRNPLLKTLISDLVKLLLDVIGTENPLERAALGLILTQIINRLGIDRVAGELLGALLGPLAANPNPATLHDVTDDLAKRISALEAQWARYMTDGGPELDQAGRQWKQLTGWELNAAMLAFFGTAVAAPDRWARDVADTAGVLVNDTISSVAHLIRRV